MSARPVDRVLASAGTASFALAATVFAHVAGGGQLPSVFVVAAAAIPTLLVTLGLSWLKAAKARIAVTVGVGQGLFHYLFAATEASAARSSLTIVDGHVGHHSSGLVLSSSHIEHVTSHPGAAMAISHIVAAFFIAAVMMASSHLTANLDAIAQRLRQLVSPLEICQLVPTGRRPAIGNERRLTSLTARLVSGIRGPPSQLVIS